MIYYEAYRKFTVTEVKKEMDKIGVTMQDYARSLVAESISPYSCPMKCNKKYPEMDESKIKKINYSENVPILNIDPQTNVWKYGDIPDDLYTSYKLPPSAFFKTPNNIPLYNVTSEEEAENRPKSKFGSTYPMSTYYKCKWNGDINNTGGLSSEDGKYSSIPCSYKSNYSEEGKYICMDNPNKVGLEKAKCDVMEGFQSATSTQFKEGINYIKLYKSAPTDAPPGKIEVIYFFWYSSPNCNKFELTFASWIKNLPNDIVVKRVPVVFNDSFLPQQLLYYTLEAMGLVETLNAKVFNAINVEKQPLNTPNAIATWVSEQGVNKTKFMNIYNSFGVKTKATKATQLQEAYKIEGVPSFGINGLYYTDGFLAGSNEKALQVTNYLCDLIRKTPK